MALPVICGFADAYCVLHLHLLGGITSRRRGIKLYDCLLRRVPKKGATKLMVVTSSNLNHHFQNSFTTGKEKEISNKYAYFFPPHLKYVAALPLGIQKSCHKIAKQN